MTKSKASGVAYWGLVIALSLALASYLFYRVSDARFRYSILDSFLATMLGVLVGVPVALAIDRVRQREEDRRSREREAAERARRLGVLADRMSLELEHNLETAEKLKEALLSAHKSRSDLWEWAVTIVDSFSLESTGEYNRSDLRLDMPPTLDDSLFHANYDLKRLRNCVRQAARKHDFLYGHAADIQGANRMLEELRQTNQSAHELLRATRDSLNDWRSAA